MSTWSTRRRPATRGGREPTWRVLAVALDDLRVAGDHAGLAAPCLAGHLAAVEGGFRAVEARQRAAARARHRAAAQLGPGALPPRDATTAPPPAVQRAPAQPEAEPAVVSDAAAGPNPERVPLAEGTPQRPGWMRRLGRLLSGA